MQVATTSIAVLCLAAVVLPAATLGQSGGPPPGNGKVSFFAAAGNEIVSLSTKLVVPGPPDRSVNPAGTLFLWPGLQPRPDDANFLPIDNGVLQPVLTWGRSCAPGVQPKDGWWISAQYVNTVGNYTGYMGCFGGPIISAEAGDKLLISMSLYRSIWTQTILDLKTNKSTDFHASLAGQAQGYARFCIEPDPGVASPDVTFLETTIGFARPHSDNCALNEHGPDDVVGSQILLANGQSCYIEKIVLKGPGEPQPAKARAPAR